MTSYWQADCTTDFLGDTSPPPPYVQVKAKVISPLDTSDLHAYTFLTLECVKEREFTKSEEKDWGNQKMYSVSEIVASKNDGAPSRRFQ